MEQAFIEQLNRIEQYALMAAKNMFTVEEAALYIGISKDHLYKLVCSRQIPHFKPRGKMVYFEKAEIDQWLKQGKVMTQAEAENYAISYNNHQCLANIR